MVKFSYHFDSCDIINIHNYLLLILFRCLEVGIQEVTVYAFSIENFKRSQEEVDTLMSLAREKFAKLLEEKEKLRKKGIKIRVIGNLDMLPKDVQKTLAEAMLLTKDNNRSILNVAFAYTSRDEITNSIKTIMQGYEDNELLPEDLTDTLIDKCLYTSECSDVDLLVRTSGENRFSDFLLWQIPSTVFYFTEALWPDFTLWNLLAAVFYYQRCHVHKKSLKQHFSKTRTALSKSSRLEKFLTSLEDKRYAKLVEMSKFV
ncbi:hypothetical protein ACKWTF_009833 [Chironomus riparius]